MLVSEGSERVKTATLSFKLNHYLQINSPLQIPCPMHVACIWTRTGQTNPDTSFGLVKRSAGSLNRLPWRALAQALALARTHRVTRAPLRGAHLRVRAPRLEDGTIYRSFTGMIYRSFTGMIYRSFTRAIHMSFTGTIHMSSPHACGACVACAWPPRA